MKTKRSNLTATDGDSPKNQVMRYQFEVTPEQRKALEAMVSQSLWITKIRDLLLKGAEIIQTASERMAVNPRLKAGLYDPDKKELIFELDIPKLKPTKPQT
jgi:hypothetical protein